MPNDRPPPSSFVDRTLDYTFPRDGDSYRILWDETGLFPVDMDDMDMAMVTSVFTTGAQPNTSGIT